MSKFIKRPEYFKKLQKEFNLIEKDDGRFITMRGRRRIGKSTLIEEWLLEEGINNVFFTASQKGIAQEMQLFQNKLRDSTLEVANKLEGISFTSWDGLLGFIASTITMPSVIVLDEFPYLMQDDDSFPATIQKLWDTKLSKVPILLILVGSDISMMESLSQYNNPLFGRPTKEMVIDPLRPSQVAEILQTDAANALDSYLVVGGFPRLAQLWPSGYSRKQFLLEELDDSASQLIVAGERILAAEFPNDIQAKQVLMAIGSGETTFKNIASQTGISEMTLTRSLKLLKDEKRIIAASHPFSALTAKSTSRYHVADPYLRFWMKFIAPNMAEIERGRGELVVDKIEVQWSQWAGKAIEPIIHEAMNRMLPNKEYDEAVYVGSFWNRNNNPEIDLVGLADLKKPKRVEFIGSVKWRDNKTFTKMDAKKLIEDRPKVPGTDDKTLLVGLSRNGFDDNAKSNLDITLGPDEILKAW